MYPVSTGRIVYAAFVQISVWRCPYLLRPRLEANAVACCMNAIRDFAATRTTPRDANCPQLNRVRQRYSGAAYLRIDLLRTEDHEKIGSRRKL